MDATPFQSARPTGLKKVLTNFRAFFSFRSASAEPAVLVQVTLTPAQAQASQLEKKAERLIRAKKWSEAVPLLAEAALLLEQNPPYNPVRACALLARAAELCLKDGLFDSARKLNLAASEVARLWYEESGRYRKRFKQEPHWELAEASKNADFLRLYMEYAAKSARF